MYSVRRSPGLPMGRPRQALPDCVEPDDCRAQRLCEFEDLEITHPPRSRLDSSDREPVNVPTLPLTPCCEFLLRKTVMVTNPSNLFANHVFSLGHLCAYEHRSLAKPRLAVCARTRNKDGTRPTPQCLRRR